MMQIKYKQCLALNISVQDQFDHLKVELVNLALHLVEDRPPANATSPGSLPVDVAIPSLTIVREKSGLFSIQPTGGWLSYFQRIGQFI